MGPGPSKAAEGTGRRFPPKQTGSSTSVSALPCQADGLSTVLTSKSLPNCSWRWDLSTVDAGNWQSNIQTRDNKRIAAADKTQISLPGENIEEEGFMALHFVELG
jgi:hypothetical protein